MSDRIKFRSLASGDVTLGGIIGRRIDLCIDRRVASQDVERLVKPYRLRTDGPDGFRGEFWGKWFTSLVLAYTYRPTPALAKKMRAAVRAMIDTQTEDGCISTYPAEVQQGMWDVWSRKYALLGLVVYHETTGDSAALGAAEAMVEHLMTQAGPGQVNLADRGHWAWQGLPPSSILEPVAMLWRITGKPKYRELAEWIISCWSKPSAYLPEGLRLIEQAVAGADPRKVGNPKAYEQMSCFEGLCEMYRVGGNARYLDAAVQLAMGIRRAERTIVGSGCNHEMWCDTVRYQTELLEQPLETCATVTWMKLCFRLLQLTGDPMWADELELTLYNALPAAMTPDGAWWSYYSPLVGERVASHMQYEDVGLSCCVANGPRAMLLTHRWAVMQDDAGPIVNLFSPGEAKFTTRGSAQVALVQETDYPIGNVVRFTVRADKPVAFDLRLRIPEFSTSTTVHTPDGSLCPPAGRYASLCRTWHDGDQVTLELDLRARAVAAPSGSPHLAVQRGPVVLAMDSRLTAPDRTSLRLLTHDNGTVDARLVPSSDPLIHLTCEVPFVHHKVHIVKTPRTVTMCDYASAGNAWSGEDLFRVWLPQPMFMQEAFIPETWKLMYPDTETRPDTPGCRNDFD